MMTSTTKGWEQTSNCYYTNDSHFDETKLKFNQRWQFFDIPPDTTTPDN
ncbi:MAG: hypothetical protein QNJ65_08530 [Xenococcaceae cyanobacterium MO_234.B1]|nr:hypothetical protein [Xenococcaceae cyanobacterium MO_234.B1]